MNGIQLEKERIALSFMHKLLPLISKNEIVAREAFNQIQSCLLDWFGSFEDLFVYRQISHLNWTQLQRHSAECAYNQFKPLLKSAIE